MKKKYFMKKNNTIYLKHILEAINNIENYIENILTVDAFTQSKITKDAVLRNFEIIGEATNNLENEFITQHPQIEWDKIISMRNFIIHEYFGVDLELVWETIKKDLPILKKEIEKLLS